MTAHSYQRIFAYILDLFIISIITAFLTIWIPNSKKYDEAYKEEMDTVSKYLDGEIEDNEFESKTKDLTYTLNKERVIFSLVDLIVTLAYFGSFAYYSDGQTFGKKALKIRVVSDNNQLSHLKFIIRALLINGCLASSLEIISVLFLSKDYYYSVLTSIEFIQMFFVVVSIFMVIFRQDKRGLHDFICDTKVVKV